MTDFQPILLPNLPESRVKHAVISPKYSAVTLALNSLGIETLFVSECNSLHPSVSTHADMLVHHNGGNKLFLEHSQIWLSDRLKAMDFDIVNGSVTLDEKYPNDILLNCCGVGDKLICGTKHKFSEIYGDKTVIRSPQGYAKCSVAVVDEGSIITDDESIYHSARAFGLDVLLVSKGDVELEGLNYGFIGGCCGKLNSDTLAFCGDIHTHKDCNRILSFLRERGVYAHSLFGGKLLDIGSIIPLTQNNIKQTYTK